MKNLASTIIIALAVIISVIILGKSFKNRNEVNKISVTGLGTKDFISDLIVWSGSFSRKKMELKDAYTQLGKDREKIKSYITSKGFTEKDIVFSSVNIQKDYDYSTTSDGKSRSVFSGYILIQTVSIESNDVEKVENLSREVTELIDNDVIFNSNSPSYYYTKLADLKIEMIANATKDAKERASKVVINGGGKLGSLKNANLGVFQITAQNSSDEDYSWGGTFNTSSKKKTANITVRLEYDIK